MNKDFWDRMAKLWCMVASLTDFSKIAEAANNQAQEDKKHKSGYSLNPLDDEDEDEDDWL